MQTAFTILIITASALYLCLKWMPAGLRRFFKQKLSSRHPRLASKFEQLADQCASSCSSSCNSCAAKSSPKNDNTTKPVIFLRKL